MTKQIYGKAAKYARNQEERTSELDKRRWERRQEEVLDEKAQQKSITAQKEKMGEDYPYVDAPRRGEGESRYDYQDRLRKPRLRGWENVDTEDLTFWDTATDATGGMVRHPRERVMSKGERMHTRAKRGHWGTSLMHMESESDLYNTDPTYSGKIKPDKRTIGLLQSRLKKYGYDLGPTGVDKKWGKHTEGAYQEYKKDWYEGYSADDIIQRNAKKPQGIIQELQERSKPGAARWEDTIIDDMKRY